MAEKGKRNPESGKATLKAKTVTEGQFRNVTCIRDPAPVVIDELPHLLWQSIDGTFKSADELREIYEGKGIKPENEIITYCRIGECSTHTWFALTQLLGYPNVRNYDDSWAEWRALSAPLLDASHVISSSV